MSIYWVPTMWSSLVAYQRDRYMENQSVTQDSRHQSTKWLHITVEQWYSIGMTLSSRGVWQCLETFLIVMTRYYWHLSGGSLCRMFSSILQCTARHPQQRIIWSNNAAVEKPCCRNVTGERVSIRWKRPLFCKILPEYDNINNPLKCSSFLKKLQCMYWLISLFLSNWSVFWLLGGHQSGTSCALLSVRGFLENAPWVLT